MVESPTKREREGDGWLLPLRLREIKFGSQLSLISNGFDKGFERERER